jgi:hypothetical protein
MAANEGTGDRIVRLVIGVALLLVGALVLDSGIARWVVLVVGAVALVTGLTGWCGLYAVLGCSTTKKAGDAAESVQQTAETEATEAPEPAPEPSEDAKES